MERTDDSYHDQLYQLTKSLREQWSEIANLEAGDYRPVLDYLAEHQTKQAHSIVKKYAMFKELCDAQHLC